MSDPITELTRADTGPHSKKLWTSGRALLDRILRSEAFSKLHKELGRRDPMGSFYHPTCGLAAAVRDLLRNPRTRGRLLKAVHPQNPTLSDEELARSFVIASMFVDLIKRLDAADDWFDQFNDEACIAQELHDHGYDKDARHHISDAVTILYAARTSDVTTMVRSLGKALDSNFDLRSPRLIAQLVTHALGIPAGQLKERHVRYLCGWERARDKVRSTT
jgi:hypothetical protein